MRTSTTRHSQAEHTTSPDLFTGAGAQSLHTSPGAERTEALRPATDEPQTADQRLPLLVVLLASFFLLGVGAGWQPAEPSAQEVSPPLDQAAQTVETTRAVASGDASARPESASSP